jgi:hypothetical protein
MDAREKLIDQDAGTSHAAVPLDVIQTGDVTQSQPSAHAQQWMRSSHE